MVENKEKTANAVDHPVGFPPSDYKALNSVGEIPTYFLNCL